MKTILEQLKTSRILVFFFLLTLALGILSNRFFFPDISPIDLSKQIWQNVNHPALLLAIPVLTLMNIGLRYLKWIFLLRTFGIVFPSRTIFIYYTISFIGNLTPLYFLYLIRIIPLAEKRKNGLFILALDIGLDLLAVLILSIMPGMAPIATLLFFVTILLASLLRSTHANPLSVQLLSIASMLLLSITTWFLTAAGLSFTLMSFDLAYLNQMDLFSAARLLAASNLTSALSMIPAGVYINGYNLIQGMQALHIPYETALYATALFRGMTVYLAIGIGLFTLFFFRRNLRSDLHTENHFNIIADEYGEQIPAHIREKMLSRKITVNRQYFQRPSYTKGLDAGCGQGWYLEQMTQLGYKMKGIDYSAGQVALAKSNNKALPEKDIQQGSVAEIPFVDNTFDFAYTINVLHHLPNRALQLQAFDEFLRVLRPGGRLIIHEINVLNPLFRLYMSYIFPLINTIDEGTEIWILENDADLRKRFQIVGAEFFTFLPDFLPRRIVTMLTPLERWLERTPFTRRYSAHYALVLQKAESEAPSRPKTRKAATLKQSKAGRPKPSKKNAKQRSSPPSQRRKMK